MMMKSMNNISCLHCLAVFATLFLLTACYHQRPSTPDGYASQGVALTEREKDSLSFQSIHHYTENYNFVVVSDSLPLLRQQPEELLSGMPVDTFHVYRNDPLVVADIRILPADTVDSVWVEVARDQESFGWAREEVLLAHVSPDDPISEFITLFSDNHLLTFLSIIVVIAAGYWVQLSHRKRVYLVHVRDIDSFYPSLLAVLVAAAATLYASIQMFYPEMWRHFYYHPTLNPFTVPTILGVFLAAVWAMLIIAIAAADDVFRKLSLGEALLYLGGLVAVCSFNYIVFSFATLYYIGYVLLVGYAVVVFSHYHSSLRTGYLCGYCGKPLHHKGRCPYCGADNQ